MGVQTLLTLEQFDQLPVVESVRCELDGGELATMTEPMPQTRRREYRGGFAGFL